MVDLVPRNFHIKQGVKHHSPYHTSEPGPSGLHSHNHSLVILDLPSNGPTIQAAVTKSLRLQVQRVDSDDSDDEIQLVMRKQSRGSLRRDPGPDRIKPIPIIYFPTFTFQMWLILFPHLLFNVVDPVPRNFHTKQGVKHHIPLPH